MSTKRISARRSVAGRAKQRGSSSTPSRRSKPSTKSEPYRIQRAVLDFDVYGYRVTFVFTNDLQRARNEYDKVIGRTFDCGGAGAFHSFADWESDPKSFIFFREDACAEQIAHESAHAVLRMFRWASIKVTEQDNGEVFAYHLGHLVGNITRAQKKLVKQSRGK